MNNKLLKDFDVFSRALVMSNDVDPTYPVIKDILKHKPHYQPEWFVFVYVAYYSLESAVQFCDMWPTYEEYKDNTGKFIKLREERRIINKFGHERRGTCRNPKNQLVLFKAAGDFIKNDLKTLEKASNLDFRVRLESKPWHGGWSAFKIAEIFEKSLGWENLKIKDLGLDGRDPNSNDGPIGGLRWIFGRDNKYNQNWFKTWNRFGSELSKAWDFDIGEVETCLCKWHKTVSGKYFVGHDIQEFVELKHVLDKDVYWQIMSGNFDKGFWKGKNTLDKHLKSHYLSKGEILYGDYGKKITPISIADIILSL